MNLFRWRWYVAIVDEHGNELDSDVTKVDGYYLRGSAQRCASLANRIWNIFQNYTGNSQYEAYVVKKLER